MLTIGRLARQSGVTTDPIRFYERLGLLAPAKKTTSGYRLFSEDSVRRLAFIRHARRCGFSLSEVREVLASDGQLAKAYALAIHKKAQIERSIEDLRLMATILTQFIAARANVAARGGAAAESALGDALADQMARAQPGMPPRSITPSAFAEAAAADLAAGVPAAHRRAAAVRPRSVSVRDPSPGAPAE